MEMLHALLSTSFLDDVAHDRNMTVQSLRTEEARSMALWRCREARRRRKEIVTAAAARDENSSSCSSSDDDDNQQRTMVAAPTTSSNTIRDGNVSGQLQRIRETARVSAVRYVVVSEVVLVVLTAAVVAMLLPALLVGMLHRTVTFGCIVAIGIWSFTRLYRLRWSRIFQGDFNHRAPDVIIPQRSAWLWACSILWPLGSAFVCFCGAALIANIMVVLAPVQPPRWQSLDLCPLLSPLEPGQKTHIPPTASSSTAADASHNPFMFSVLTSTLGSADEAHGHGGVTWLRVAVIAHALLAICASRLFTPTIGSDELRSLRTSRALRVAQLFLFPTRSLVGKLIATSIVLWVWLSSGVNSAAIPTIASLSSVCVANITTASAHTYSLAAPSCWNATHWSGIAAGGVGFICFVCCSLGSRRHLGTLHRFENWLQRRVGAADGSSGCSAHSTTVASFLLLAAFGSGISVMMWLCVWIRIDGVLFADSNSNSWGDIWHRWLVGSGDLSWPMSLVESLLFAPSPLNDLMCIPVSKNWLANSFQMPTGHGGSPCALFSTLRKQADMDTHDTAEHSTTAARAMSLIVVLAFYASEQLSVGVCNLLRWVSPPNETLLDSVVGRFISTLVSNCHTARKRASKPATTVRTTLHWGRAATHFTAFKDGVRSCFRSISHRLQNVGGCCSCCNTDRKGSSRQSKQRSSRQVTTRTAASMPSTGASRATVYASVSSIYSLAPTGGSFGFRGINHAHEHTRLLPSASSSDLSDNERDGKAASSPSQQQQQPGAVLHDATHRHAALKVFAFAVDLSRNVKQRAVQQLRSAVADVLIEILFVALPVSSMLFWVVHRWIAPAYAIVDGEAATTDAQPHFTATRWVVNETLKVCMVAIISASVCTAVTECLSLIVTRLTDSTFSSRLLLEARTQVKLGAVRKYLRRFNSPVGEKVQSPQATTEIVDYLAALKKKEQIQVKANLDDGDSEYDSEDEEQEGQSTRECPPLHFWWYAAQFWSVSIAVVSATVSVVLAAQPLGSAPSCC